VPAIDALDYDELVRGLNLAGRARNFNSSARITGFDDALATRMLKSSNSRVAARASNPKETMDQKS
jgi:hypothetical protein